MRRHAVLGAVVLAAAACQDATSPRPINAPTRVNAAQGAAANDYIVVFKNDETDPAGGAEELTRAHGGSVRYVYRTAIKGFAVANLPAAAVEALRRNPRVAAIEPDGIMSADATQTPTPSWGLDRIDQRSLPLNDSYTYPNTGSGVTAYIIDTGILASHSDFGGRVGTGRDFIDGDTNPVDCHGHGTHVAGTVGGSSYGVAKTVTLVAVRVLGCGGSGTTSGVIAGVDWVASQPARPAVANMSLGGATSSFLDDAVQAAIADGISFAVAAGNSNANACNSSPARAPDAITVGSTTLTDARSSFSNYGTCLDIFAPGSAITSAWIGISNTATNTISGTSMASPHVAGAAALLLESNPSWSPAQVRDALVANATGGVVGSAGSGSPNRLLFVGPADGGGGGGGGGSPPVAGISKSCTNFTCTFTSTSTGASDLQYLWTFAAGDTESTKGPHQRTYGARRSATVTLKVTDDNGTSTAQVSVSCNPKKCQ